MLCHEAQQKKRKIEPNEVVDVDMSDKEDEQSYSLSSQLWLPDLHLNQEDKLILETRQWLTGKHIIAAQELLGKQFSHVQGLQLPFLEQRDQFKAMPSIGVQILNENNNHWFNHWLCVSTTSSLPDTIDIYDSLRMKRISTHVIKQCGLLLNSQERRSSFVLCRLNSNQEVVIVIYLPLQMLQNCVLDYNQATLCMTNRL